MCTGHLLLIWVRVPRPVPLRKTHQAGQLRCRHVPARVLYLNEKPLEITAVHVHAARPDSWKTWPPSAGAESQRPMVTAVASSPSHAYTLACPGGNLGVRSQI